MRAILCVGFSGIALANPGLRRAAAQLGLAAAERVAASEVPINVRRFMRCILPLREEKGTAIRPKKKGGLTNGPPLELKPSELEAQAELHAARQVSAAGMQESRRGYAAWIAGGAGWPDAVHAAVNAIVLSMIEKIEILTAKVKRSCFGEGETLEQPEVEIQAAGVAQRIATHVAEGQAGRDRVSRGIIKQWAADAGHVDLRRDPRVTCKIRARACANAVRHARCVTKIGTIGDAKRSAGLCDGDARDLPSS